jgi:hypothetical protein
MERVRILPEPGTIAAVTITAGTALAKLLEEPLKGNIEGMTFSIYQQTKGDTEKRHATEGV